MGIFRKWRGVPFTQKAPTDFLKRLVTSYLLALTVAMVLLILIDKGPLDDLQLALRRAVLIAFPASFAATAVDYIK